MSNKLYDILTKVRFRVGGKVFEVSIGDELLINRDDPHNQVERIPAVMGYFGSIIADLEQELEDKKDIQKQIEARLDKTVRAAGFTGEARILKKIQRSSKWMDASLEVNRAKRNFQKARNLYFALRAKADALGIRSADIRAVPSDSLAGVNKEDVMLFSPKKKKKAK